MFNTRSGFWMLISIGALSPISAGSLLVLGLNSDVTYQNFVRASGFPMSVILPIIAILAVTGEWSQRSGLTTFTLVPSRERVIGAKAIATLLVGLGAVSVAFAVGALGNVAGSALAGVEHRVGHFVVHGTPDGALQPGGHGLRLRTRCRAWRPGSAASPISRCINRIWSGECATISIWCSRGMASSPCAMSRSNRASRANGPRHMPSAMIFS